MMCFKNWVYQVEVVSSYGSIRGKTSPNNRPRDSQGVCSPPPVPAFDCSFVFGSMEVIPLYKKNYSIYTPIFLYSHNYIFISYSYLIYTLHNIPCTIFLYHTIIQHYIHYISIYLFSNKSMLEYANIWLFLTS